MSDLLIFNPHDSLIVVLSNEAEGACPFWDAPFKETLNNGSTFEFTVPADHEDAQYITAENQVAFLDKDNNFRLFVIKEPEKNNSANGPVIRSVCEPAMLELTDEVITDVRAYNASLQTALTRALQGTRWKVGQTTDFGINSTNYYYINVVESMQKIINTWGGELRDRVEIDGNKITGRYIDILPRRGADTGKLWEIDKDILTISHKVQSYPKTALYGRGSSLEVQDGDGNATGGFTRKITFAEVEWKVANGDPVDKPYGQEWVGDPSALSVYGRKNDDGSLRHRFGLYDNSEQKDPAALLKETWDILQKQKHPIENYSMDVFLLEEITGHEHEKVRLGDTTFAIDRSFAEPIEVEERVIVYEYDVADPDNTGHVELGQYIDLYSDDERLDKIEAKLNDKSGIWDLGGGPVTDEKIENITPGKVTGVIASGGVKTIMLEWDYVNHIYLATYEVYASQIKGFVPDTSNLIFKGKTSGYNHKAETDEVWYFRVRAVNTHGVAGAYSDEVQGNTVRVISDDILFGPDVAKELEELSKTAEILSKEAKDKIVVPAFEYTNGKVAVEEAARQLEISTAKTELWTAAEAEAKRKADAAQLEAIRQAALDAQNKVNTAKTALETSIATKANAEWVNGQLQLKVSKEEFDRLEIGGRNLIENSADVQRSSSIYNFPLDYSKLTGLIGKEITASFDLRADSLPLTMDCYLRNVSNASIVGKKSPDFDVTTDFVRYSFTFLVPESVSEITNGSFAFRRRAGSGSYEVRNVQLEKGNKATDWTPAPEDIFGEIDSKADVDNVYTIAQLNSKFDNVVSLNAYQTDQNGIVQRFNSAESRLTQTEQGLLSKVSKTEFDDLQLGETVYKYTSNRVGTVGSVVELGDYSAVLNTNARLVLRFYDDDQLEPNTDYIISVDGMLKDADWGVFHSRGNYSIISYRDTQEYSELIFNSGNKRDINVNIRSKIDGNRIGFVTLKKVGAVFDALSTRLSSTETAINQTADKIELKADKTEVTSLTNRISSAEASININSDEIASKVSKTEFENLQIGGRNFIPGSGEEITTSTFKHYRFDVNNLVIGQEVTASFDVKAKVGGTHVIDAYLRNMSSGLIIAGTQLRAKTISDKYERVSYTFVIPTNVATVTDIGFTVRGNISVPGGSSNTGTFTLKNVKLEKGNKATDWTPAPEDVDIRLANAESSITQQAGQILSKVEKTDYTGNVVASLINQTATTIKLKASKIELEGDVSIINGLTKIANLAVGNAQIAASAITAAKIANATITGAKIANATITNAEIADAAITSAKIGSAAVGTAAIANGAITRAKIGTAAIGTAQIENASITNSLIASNANIDAAKIGDISATKIKTGTLTGIDIQSPTTAGGLIRLNNGVISNSWGNSQIRMTTLSRYGAQQSLMQFDEYSTGAKAEIMLAGQGLELWANNNPIVLSAHTYLNSGYVLGDFSVSGTKNAAVPTSIGMVNVSAYETAEYYFGDVGRGVVANGECVIEIESLFKETVNTNIDYEVFLTPYGKGLIYVDEMTTNSFTVKGDNILFAYEIKAKRKGYEDVRLEATEEIEVESIAHQNAS